MTVEAGLMGWLLVMVLMILVIRHMAEVDLRLPASSSSTIDRRPPPASCWHPSVEGTATFALRDEEKLND
ncbi:hypothetical protein [Bradyrhizobium macuxiense]|uniref:hypothetical protein n=1 Tax=Bradyrhizobium macuxiense TaxID=1755647 RepID=UPI0019185317|nr:hypothetical protein [Bradyrhizobium macuxiense]